MERKIGKNYYRINTEGMKEIKVLSLGKFVKDLEARIKKGKDHLKKGKDLQKFFVTDFESQAIGFSKSYIFNIISQDANREYSAEEQIEMLMGSHPYLVMGKKTTYNPLP